MKLPRLTAPSLVTSMLACSRQLTMLPSRFRGGSTVSMVAATTNPLLDQAGLPRFDLIEPADVKPAVTSIIERLEADFGITAAIRTR